LILLGPYEERAEDFLSNQQYELSNMTLFKKWISLNSHNFKDMFSSHTEIIGRAPTGTDRPVCEEENTVFHAETFSWYWQTKLMRGFAKIVVQAIGSLYGRIFILPKMDPHFQEFHKKADFGKHCKP
jgi:hypothetical protein